MINKAMSKKTNGWKWFPRRLANQLIFIFGLTITFFIIALIYTVYCRVADILNQDTVQVNQSILTLVNQNFHNYIAQLDELSISLRKDSQFMRALTHNGRDGSSKTYIENQLKILFYSRNDLEELRFYIPAQGMGYIISRRDDKLKAQSINNMGAEEWYRKTVQEEYFRHIEPLCGKRVNSAGLFTFYRALVSIPGWKVLGIIALTMNRLNMDQMTQDTFNYKGEALCIYDRNNQLFYSCGLKVDLSKLIKIRPQPFERGSFCDCAKIKLNGQDYLVVFNVSETDGWKFIKVIPVNYILAQGRGIRNSCFTLGSVFILLLIGLITIVTKTITRPLRRLANQMTKVGEGDFHVKIETGGSSELIQLTEKFNFMVGRIKELIQATYLAQINEKTARLKALEAQINPHFLYNALQAIAAQAAMGKLKELNRMIEDLAFILRYIFRGGDQVRIAEEIQQVEKYLHLHQVRFDERLEVSIEKDISGDSANILIPKLAIQTLVENAIKHALENSIRQIHISVRLQIQEERLIIIVSDNGPGMTPEHLQKVIAGMADESLTEKPDLGIGLKNLDARLRLMYGEKAQLVLTSIWGHGTQASIILSLKPEGDLENG